jgi:hypothetical protein
VETAGIVEAQEGAADGGMSMEDDQGQDTSANDGAAAAISADGDDDEDAAGDFIIRQASPLWGGRGVGREEDEEGAGRRAGRGGRSLSFGVQLPGDLASLRWQKHAVEGGEKGTEIGQEAVVPAKAEGGLEKGMGVYEGRDGAEQEKQEALVAEADMIAEGRDRAMAVDVVGKQQIEAAQEQEQLRFSLGANSVRAGGGGGGGDTPRLFMGSDEGKRKQPTAAAAAGGTGDVASQPAAAGGSEGTIAGGAPEGLIASKGSAQVDLEAAAAVEADVEGNNGIEQDDEIDAAEDGSESKEDEEDVAGLTVPSEGEAALDVEVDESERAAGSDGGAITAAPAAAAAGQSGHDSKQGQLQGSMIGGYGVGAVLKAAAAGIRGLGGSHASDGKAAASEAEEGKVTTSAQVDASAARSGAALSKGADAAGGVASGGSGGAGAGQGAAAASQAIGKGNLVSSIRSFLPTAQVKKGSPTIAAGKVKCKVRSCGARSVDCYGCASQGAQASWRLPFHSSQAGSILPIPLLHEGKGKVLISRCCKKCKTQL